MPQGVGKAVGLMGLGLAGAGLMGLHRQNQRDVEGDRMPYAPLQGGFQ